MCGRRYRNSVRKFLFKKGFLFQLTDREDLKHFIRINK